MVCLVFFNKMIGYVKTTLLRLVTNSEVDMSKIMALLCLKHFPSGFISG